MLGHGHLLAVERQAGDVGREAGLVLVVHLLEVFSELRDAKPVPCGIYRVALEQDVLGGQGDVGSVQRCTVGCPYSVKNASRELLFWNSLCLGA